jgi:Cu2+-exporting ATPase
MKNSNLYRKVTFPVLKMSCAGCAANVQNILRNQSGVISADVNFANKMALIEYDTSITGAEKLQNVVRSSGYDLIIASEKDDAMKELEAKEQRYYHLLRTRTFVAIALSVGLITLSMTPLMHLSWAKYVMGFIATILLFFCGNSFFAGAYKQAKHKQMNMDTLVALSTATAYLFSLFSLFYPQFWHSRGLHAEVYFETAGVLITFILIGKLLEDRAKRKTSTAIKKLMDLQPQKATVILPNGDMEERPVENIAGDDIIWVKAGEKIPTDGILTEGHSFVDESMITGEPVPAEKNPGQNVFAGTVNQQGSFRFKATKVGHDTLVSQIIKLVNEAQNTKAPIQKTVDKIAGIFVPVVVSIALLSVVLWVILGGENALTHAFLAFVTVLIIACPCALGLATPTAIMVGMGKGAEQGILIKDMDSLETLRKVNTIVLDKTGTLTKGAPVVTDKKWMVDETEELHTVLFGMEKASAHPLSDAITAVLHKNVGNKISPKIEVLPGRGVKTTTDGDTYYVGNSRLFSAIKKENETLEWIREKESKGKTVVIFGDEKQIIALFALSDEIKETSKQAVEQLQSLGIEVVMATGDNEISAHAIAEQTGIKECLAQALPENKLQLIKQKQKAGKIVAMVGDGINDSAALAQADVSIAMGKGSDIAIDASAITIISGDLKKIKTAIRLSHDTVTTIHQNLFWAFIYNVIGIPVAAGILYPVNGFLLNPMIAGIAMALSSVSVVLNSLRFNGALFKNNSKTK